MKFRHLSNRLDESVGTAGETIARHIGRRDVLRRAIRGAAVVIAGATVGSMMNAKAAFANTCSNPDCGPTARCNGSVMPAGQYCPSGRTPCKHSQCSNCEWASGTWVACTGAGRCGGGFWLCADCRTSSSCSYCTQLSGTYCTGCCSPEEVKAEMRLHQVTTAAA